MRMISLRPARFDELGLRNAVADRIVPFLVAAMAFLAALAVAGWMGAAVLTSHWARGAGSTFTVQVPRPTEMATEIDAANGMTRLRAAQEMLTAAPGVVSAKTLSEEQIAALLQPWLGADMKTLAVPVPAVIAVRTTGDAEELTGLAAQLGKIAPGTIVEDHAAFAGRLGALSRSLQLCAGIVLLIVTLVTAAVIAAATRSGLMARREEITIVHQLGATDSYIARRFATRTSALAALGGVAGGLIALPALLALTTLAMPLGGEATPGAATFAALPVALWLLPLILALMAALIGYGTTQFTMRRWLRRLT
jgi:cell division transport system permease protein